MAEEISCAHFLIKFQGSRNPTSWRDPTGEERIKNTTYEQAVDRMKAIRAQIIVGDLDFDEVASTSDCGSAKNNGKLGAFTKGQMQQAFEDAAFALKVGELSDIVVSDSGVHIIYRYA